MQHFALLKRLIYKRQVILQQIRAIVIGEVLMGNQAQQQSQELELWQIVSPSGNVRNR